MLTTIDTIKTKADTLAQIDTDDLNNIALFDLLSSTIESVLEAVSECHTNLFVFIDDYTENRAAIAETVDSWGDGDTSSLETLQTTVTTVLDNLSTAGRSFRDAKELMERYITLLDQQRTSIRFEKTGLETEIELLNEKLEDNRKEMERYKVDEQADLWGPIELLQREQESRISRQQQLLAKKTELEGEKSENEYSLVDNGLWRRRAEDFRVSTETLQDIVENLDVGLYYTGQYFSFLSRAIDKNDPDSSTQAKTTLPLINRNIETFRKAVVVNSEEAVGG